MKQVISASRRTDIPAFYLKWLIRCFQQGRVEVRNPFYRDQVRIVELTPERVEWLVFWSRNYGAFLKHREFFRDYQLFFHFTIVSHHPWLEKHHVPRQRALQQLAELANRFGPERITWRYDPLVFWQVDGALHTNWNPQEFEQLCREVARCGVKRCYFSFVTPYFKFLRRFRKKYPRAKVYLPEESHQFRLLEVMVGVASKFHIQLYSCCNDRLLQVPGVQKGRCIDGNLLNQLSRSGTVTVAKAPTRTDCGCTRSMDVGDYLQQPCSFGCIYCYANPAWQ